MILRPYQDRAVGAFFDYFRNGGRGNPIVALPTGSGKSIVIAEIIRLCRMMDKSARVIVATHQKELVEQDYLKMRALCPHESIGIYSAGMKRREAKADILFASVQSVYNKVGEIGWRDLMLVDECHMIPKDGAGRYRTLIAGLRTYNPAMPVGGLSATPYRTGSGMLTDGDDALFTDIVIDLTQGDELVALIDAGYLSPLRPKGTEAQIDVSKVRTTGGDFNSGDLEKATSGEVLNRMIVDEVISAGVDRKSWLLFGSGVQHALLLARLMNERGIPCGVVHGDMPDDERDAALADFKSGRYRAMANANILTTGFDHPEIDLIAVARPTKSASLHVQILGRGMRVSPGKKDCLVLDFAGNTMRLGPINAIRIPKARGQGGGPSEPPTKECPKCRELVALVTRYCPACGHEFPPPEPKISVVPSSEKLIVRKEDVTYWVDVLGVRYSIHAPPNKRPTLKVSYDTELRTYHEWVCFGFDGYAGVKAGNWWLQRARTPTIPATPEEAILSAGELVEPKKILVNHAPKYPEIERYDW